MKYLITTKDNPPFLTEWFDTDNHFNKEVDMVVHDLITREYTTNGRIWRPIEEDYL